MNATAWQERRFAAWGLTLAGWYKPGEGTPLLAVHGWLDNANSFRPLAEHLARPMLALDVAGHGYSDHRAADIATHFIDHVRDLLAVADDLGWGQFDLIGHSMGAGISLLFAATFPERVRRLVLIEGLGPPTTDEVSAPATLRKAIADMQLLPGKKKPVYADFADAVLARTKGFGGLDETSCALLCERGLEQVPGGWTWRADPRLRLGSSLRLTEQQVEGFMRAVTAPTLLVAGEQGMNPPPGTPGSFAHRIAWMKDLSVQTLPGRHHLHMENPAAVASAITAFLDRQ